MKIGLRVPACEPADRVAGFVARAEAAGFDYVWIPDTQLLNREVWVTLGLAAARTSRIELGTGVTNPLTRDVTVTASAGATLDELAPGRLVVGLGSGHSSVRVSGGRTARLAELRDYIGLLRPLWRGEMVEVGGKRFRLNGATGRQLPIYLSASGPNMLQLAGELCEGVLLQVGVTPQALEYGLTNLQLGARRAGRRLEDLDVAVAAFAHVADDWKAAMRLAQPYAANFAIRHPDALRDAGIEVPDRQDESGLYPDLIHAEDWQRAIEVTSWISESMIEEFVEKFCLFGTAAELRGKVERLASYGVRNLWVRGIFTYQLPHALCEVFEQSILPARASFGA